MLLLLSACVGRPGSAVELPTSTPIQISAPASAQTRTPEQTASLTASPTVAPSPLYVVLDGEPVAIENGDSVQLTDALGAQITLDPFPPIGLSAQPVLDLYLFDPAGQPVRGAAIEIFYDMLSMPHGPFQSPAVEQADGHYLIGLDLIMFGPWGMEIEILEPDGNEPARLRIVIVVQLPSE